MGAGPPARSSSGLGRLGPDLVGDGRRPDVFISGMNAGANVGIKVFYSGPVGAAVGAAFIGVPAIAVRLHMGGGPAHWRRAAEIARVADAVVVGSALVDEVAAALEANEPAAPRVLARVKALGDAVRSVVSSASPAETV